MKHHYTRHLRTLRTFERRFFEWYENHDSENRLIIDQMICYVWSIVVVLGIVTILAITANRVMS